MVTAVVILDKKTAAAQTAMVAGACLINLTRTTCRCPSTEMNQGRNNLGRVRLKLKSPRLVFAF